jgi:hypothetical protein
MATDPLSLDFGRDKRFYVYVYFDPRPRKGRAPIYVGKGTRALGRADDHWLRRCSNPMLARIFAKLRRCRLSPEIEVVSWFDSEQGAFGLERRLIEIFGRRDLGAGTLCNLTDGGEGASGAIRTAECRAKKSAALKGRPLSPETRHKLSISHTGKIISASHRAALSAAGVGRKHSDESRAKIRSWHKVVGFSAEQLAAMSAAHRGKIVSPETRARMRASAQRRWHGSASDSSKVAQDAATTD